MEQKSFNYLLIGNGRLASHLRFYMQSQNIRVSSWNRHEHSLEDLKRLASACCTVLLAIKDAAISEFLSENSFLKEKTCVHFSGSLVLTGVTGLHPLMTFTPELYSVEFYKKISFISEAGLKTFNEVFPALPNPSFILDPTLKPLYHSLCVMSGNFTTLLWKKVFDSFEKDLKIPRETLFPYMEKIMTNLQTQASTALTGPLARREASTIRANLKALEGDPYANVYRSFVQVVAPDLMGDL